MRLPLPPLLPLPIDKLIPQILSSLEEKPNLVLQASPGSGKTTRVPPALLDAHFRKSGEILVLEPRRLAAKASAERIAHELGEPIGERIGYQFRFEKVMGRKTLVKFLTEGLFLRQLLNNPSLEGIAAVVLDEFHERHLHSDIAFGFLKTLQKTVRPDLRIVVMSATLDTGKLSAALNAAPVLNLESPVHPVEIKHLPAAPSHFLENSVRTAVQQALHDTKGQILVFLPGMKEIRRCQKALEEGFLDPAQKSTPLQIVTLHGDLSSEEQQRALDATSARRVTLATNVAETSLTLPGITAVIDSGLHRVASSAPWSGIPSLKTRPISRSSAIQRAGRAGRTAPGICYRLYTKGDFEMRPEFDAPEIERLDLSQALLELKTLEAALSGPVSLLEEFQWLEPPPAAALDAASKLLFRLGATTESGTLSPMGRKMVQIPAHPRISRLLIEGEKQGCLEDASCLGAAISEGELESGDALDQISAIKRNSYLTRARRSYLQGFREVQPGGSSERLGKAILAAFPDRVAQKRARGKTTERSKAETTEVLLSLGGTATLPDTAYGETFVLLDLQETQHHGQKKAQLQVRTWAPIHEDWLLDVEPLGVEEKEELTWDPNRKRISVRSQMVYGEITLSESPAASVPDSVAERALRLLFKSGLGIDPERATLPEWIQALSPHLDPKDVEEFECTLARVELFLSEIKGDKTALKRFWEKARPLLAGKLALAELLELSWPALVIDAMVGTDAGADLAQLRELLPSHFDLPGRKAVRVQYSLTQPPFLASRMQDFFGLKKGPSLLRGRMPLTLHLLAPNYRPVQVTTDLENFWKVHYPELRKSLSRRYPRHAWPENPATRNA